MMERDLKIKTLSQTMLLLASKVSYLKVLQRPLAPIMLADLCEDDSDLHKDAAFLEQLGKLLSDTKTAENREQR